MIVVIKISQLLFRSFNVCTNLCSCFLTPCQGGRTCFDDIWIFAKFLIGLHWVLQIPLFQDSLTYYVLKYDNFKSVGVHSLTPLKILIFLHFMLRPTFTTLLGKRSAIRKSAGNVNRPPYRYIVAIQWAWPALSAPCILEYYQCALILSKLTCEGFFFSHVGNQRTSAKCLLASSTQNSRLALFYSPIIHCISFVYGSLQGRNRHIFLRGQSHFSWFFSRREMFFPGRKYSHFGTPKTNNKFPSFSKVKSKKKKKKKKKKRSSNL